MMTNDMILFQDICDKIKKIIEAVESNNKLYDEELETLDWHSDDYEDDVAYVERQRERTIVELEEKIPNYTFKIFYKDGDELITNTQELYNTESFPEIEYIKDIDIL